MHTQGIAAAQPEDEMKMPTVNVAMLTVGRAERVDEQHRARPLPQRMRITRQDGTESGDVRQARADVKADEIAARANGVKGTFRRASIARNCAAGAQ